MASVRHFVMILGAICGVASAASAQTTVTLSAPGSQVNVDTMIQGGASASVDFSTRDTFATKVSSPDYTRRIMLKFDTQNYIPAGATITSARLELVLKKAESSEQRPLTAYYVNRSFVTGDTTWRTYRPDQPWSTPGGDLGSSFGTTYVGNAAGSVYSFNLTTLVQRAVSGGFGSSRYTRVALIDTGAQTAGNYREFYSTRASSASLRPRLVVSYATSTSPTSPTPSGPSGTTLRVMQWNIHKTKGSDGVCNPDRIANAIVAQNPQVVSLNEVNFFSGECAWTFDMGEKLETLLEQKTGATWYRQSVNVEGGSSGYGNVLLSRLRPVSSGSTLLSYTRGVAEMTLVVNGRNVTVFSTHVDYANATYRTTQINEAVRWLAGFTEPRILMGDFNTWPDTSDYQIVAKVYGDDWNIAKAAGTASSYNGTGATHGTSRLDYVFSSKVSALTVKSVKVPDTRVNGVYPSDHDPVVVVFNVN